MAAPSAEPPAGARHWGRAPWRALPALEAVALPRRTEVLVVGAGFTGLAAATALTRAGAHVCVLEAARLGEGSSGRSGGLVLEGTAAGPLPGAEGSVPALAARVAAEGIDCELDLRGCIEVRHGPPDIPGWPDAGGTVIIPVDEVPGGSLEPAALVAGLLGAARRAGAVVLEGARVRALEPGPPARAHVGGAVVEAERVLVATNAFLPELAPRVVLRSALTFALATEPLPRATREAVRLGERPFYTVDVPYLWGRTTRDGRLVFGAGLLFAPPAELEHAAVDHGDAAGALARLEARVRAFHPALADVRVTHRWGGPVAFRAGGVPVLAALPEAPHVVLAGAYAGHGVAFSLRAGDLAAARLLGAGALPPWGDPDPGV